MSLAVHAMPEAHAAVLNSVCRSWMLWALAKSNLRDYTPSEQSHSCTTVRHSVHVPASRALRPRQVMYYTAQWTWTRRIIRIELFNEPELELCWNAETFVQQTMIRCTFCADAGMLDAVLVSTAPATSASSSTQPPPADAVR